MQRNWIGKSEGLRVRFAFDQPVPAHPEPLEVFTTRHDTLFGASFIAISPDHPLAGGARRRATRRSPTSSPSVTAPGPASPRIETAEKKGFDTGLRVVHPFRPEVTLPVYRRQLRADGLRHRRDLRLPGARPARPRLRPEVRSAASFRWSCRPATDPTLFAVGDEAYDGDGTLFNSDFLDGLAVPAAKEEVARRLEETMLSGAPQGARQINYRLRDWGISRQRYWGCPIPVIHCRRCGVVPVPAEELPVRLPEDVTFDKPGNPLDRHPTWKHVACPNCGGPATRETDTMDTFVDSSWYFARFTAPHAATPTVPATPITGCPSTSISAASSTRSCTSSTRASSPARMQATGHLGLDEPFAGLFTQGMVVHETYRRADGSCASPAEVRIVETDGQRRARRRSPPAPSRDRRHREDVEVEAQHRRPDRHHRQLRRRHRALVHALRLAARARRDLDRGGRRRRLPLRPAHLAAGRRSRAEQILPPPGTPRPGDDSGAAAALRKAAHRALAAVEENSKALRFNVAVARIYELVNAIAAAEIALLGPDKADRTLAQALREALEMLVRHDGPDDAAPRRGLLGGARSRRSGCRPAVARIASVRSCART